MVSTSKTVRHPGSFVKKIVRGLTMVMLLIAIVFCIDFFLLMRGKVYRNVSFAGEPIGGFSHEQFSRFVDRYASGILSKTMVLELEGSEIQVFPENIGLSFEKENLWALVYKIGREGTVFDRFNFWVRSFGGNTSEVSFDFLADEHRYYNFAERWEDDANLKPVFEGAIHLEDGRVQIRLPEAGRRLEREETLRELLHGFLKKESGSHIQARLTEVLPKRSLDELSRFAQKLNRILSSPLVLQSKSYKEAKIELSPKDLFDILEVRVPIDPELPPSLHIKDEELAKRLVLLEVQDAKFKVGKNYLVSLTPATSGFDVDYERTRNALQGRFSEETDSYDSELFVAKVHPPEFTEAEARALGVVHLVSEFTTHHPCCGARVENIHRIADMLDGVIIRPGESFNVNQFIGERTLEKGFKEAGSIFEGKMNTSIGGGISQFITTLHNAVYWGGYQIVEHKPHSIYFLRYPHGIEATIDWPYVHYIFKNDTKSAIVIDTEYTNTSITVRILGDNGGRVLRGDHRSWSTPMKILRKGDDSSRIVISHVDDAHNFTSPQVSYISDPQLKRGDRILERIGKKGWHTLVKREIFIGEERYSLDVWPIVYRSGKETLYRVHPCDNPDEEHKPKNC